MQGRMPLPVRYCFLLDILAKNTEEQDSSSNVLPHKPSIPKRIRLGAGNASKPRCWLGYMAG